MSSAPDAKVERPPLAPEDGAFDQLAAEPGTSRGVLAQLAAARERGRLAHALLFAGPRGTGKRHCAFRFAQLLACETDGAVPCRRCASCTRVERGLDVDVMSLEPAWDEKKKAFRGEITVEQVRQVQDRLGFRSAGKRRVVVIDPADRLSLVAQEAMLKTLEEPPDGVSLVLCTTRPSALKPTIRSRAQTLRFAPPSTEALAAVVTAWSGRAPDAALLAAALSGGDLRRALALDPELALRRWTDLARALYLVLGPQGESKARDLAISVLPKKSDDGEAAEENEGVGAWLTLLEQVLDDVLRAGEHGAAEAGRRVPGGEKALASLAQRLSPPKAGEALEALEEARRDLDLHMHAKVTLTHLLLRIHGLRES